MPDGKRPGALYSVKKCKIGCGMAERSGSARSPAIKERYRGYRLGVKRLKGLSQILKQRACQPEICGFEAFREAVVHERERMPGLIALAVFGKHACQGHRRP